MEDKKGVYGVLEGKLEGKRPLERLWRRWVENIKMYFHEVFVGERTGSIWLSIGTRGGHFCIQ
jgi:hypothetical protein